MLAEERLLVSLVRVVEGTESEFPRSIFFSGKKGNRVAVHLPAVDWERFLQIAELHGLSGIVWSAVRRVEEPVAVNVPAWVQDRLRELYYGTCAVNTLAIERLRELSNRFLSHNVGFLVLKGMVLLGEVYEDIGTRPLNDIDILIKPEDLPVVDSLLRKNGYKNTKYSPREYISGPVVVELHTRLVDLVTPVRLNEKYVPTSLTDEVIWKEQAITNTLGFPLPTVCEDHTLTLCLLHMAYKHEFERLVWCVDFVRLLRRQVAKEGWQGLLRIAGETGTSCLMSDALSWAGMSLGLRVPGNLYRGLLKKGRPLLQKKLLTALYNGALTGLSRHVYSLLRTRGFCGKIRFLLRAITPSRRILSMQSRRHKPGSLSYLKHCYRMVREVMNLVAAVTGIQP